MTERAYRLLIGILIIAFLFFEFKYAMWILVILMCFEALTNLRVPIVASKLLYPNDIIRVTEGENQSCSVNYEAERMLRWITMSLILLGISTLTEDQLWYLPWLVGLMLLLSGITGICPMVMALRKLGLK